MVDSGSCARARADARAGGASRPDHPAHSRALPDQCRRPDGRATSADATVYPARVCPAGPIALLHQRAAAKSIRDQRAGSTHVGFPRPICARRTTGHGGKGPAPQ